MSGNLARQDLQDLACVAIPNTPIGYLVFLLWLLLLILVLLGAVRLITKGLQKRTASPFPNFPDWDPKDKWTSLSKVCSATIQQGESAIEWYRENIRTMRLGSRMIRLFAIALATIGALFPLAVASLRGHETLVKLLDPQWGYFSFAAAAALVAVDRFFGFSTGWVRYIKTQLALERAAAALRYDWTALISKVENQEPTADQLQGLLQKLREFIDFVHMQIQQETEAWVLEFQSNLADLVTTVKAQAQAVKPGSVQITVTNANEFDGGVTALLDHMEERAIDGIQCIFPSVSPGTHEVSVSGKKGGKIFSAGSVVRVASDSLATASITLPVT